MRMKRLNAYIFATMCGDPPNIIIGTSLGYSFMDFIMNTGVIAAVSLVAVLIYFYVIFRKDLVAGTDVKIDYSTLPSPESTITDKKGFIISTIIFLCTVVLLVTHALTGLTVSTIGVLVAVVWSRPVFWRFWPDLSERSVVVM